jgi:hypothetical protein
VNVPALIIVVPLEGRARAMLVCESFEEQERLALELALRGVWPDVSLALLELADVLDAKNAA